MLPAYIFKAIPQPLLARSVSRSRPRSAFFRRPRRVQRTQPVAKSSYETFRRSSNLRSPSGSLDPSSS